MLPGPAPTRHSRQDVGAEEVPVLREAIIAIHVRRRIRGAALLRHVRRTERPAPAHGPPGRPAASGSLTRGMPGAVVTVRGSSRMRGRQQPSPSNGAGL